MNNTIYSVMNIRHALFAILLALLPAGVMADDVITYVLTDALGSPVAYSNEQGAVIERQYYLPYGKPLNADVSDDEVGFTGHVHDHDTGLIYMEARYYDPVIGRFLSVDPVTFSPDKPKYFNRYWYANGNPYLFVDPAGRDTVSIYGSISLQAFGYGGEISLEAGVSFGDDPFDLGVAGTLSTPKEVKNMPDQVGFDTGGNIGGAHYDASLEELDSIPTESIEIDVANVSVEAVTNSETGEKYGTRITIGTPQLSAGIEDETTGAVSVRGATEDVARYIEVTSEE